MTPEQFGAMNAKLDMVVNILTNHLSHHQNLEIATISIVGTLVVGLIIGFIVRKKNGKGGR